VGSSHYGLWYPPPSLFINSFVFITVKIEYGLLTGGMSVQPQVDVTFGWLLVLLKTYFYPCIALTYCSCMMLNFGSGFSQELIDSILATVMKTINAAKCNGLG